MSYKFYITHNAQPPVEVFPLEFKEGSIVSEKEEGQLFFRRKFDGRLVFMNRKETTSVTPITDFTYLRGIEEGSDRCLEISLDIQKSCDGGEFESWWRGYFSVTDGKWNLSRCSVEFTDIKPDDEYRCLIEGGDIEVNMLSASPIVTTSTTIVTDYEFYTCRDTSGACAGSLPGGGGWLLFHTEEIEGAWNSIYYREIAVTACLAQTAQEPSGLGWNLLSDDCLTSGFATYVRTPVTVYTNNPNPDVAAGDCEPDGSGGYLEIFPPRAKTLNVTRTNTPVTPAIIGYDEAIASISGYDEEYTFMVPNNPGSTYTWSGTFVSVISGQGTNVVTVKFTNTGTVTLQVVETTICSTAAAITKNIDVQDAGSLSPIVIPQGPTGVTRVCKDQEGVIYTMPVLPELFTTDVIWSVSAGATIASGQGTNEVTIDFGDGSSGPVTVSFSADNTVPLSNANINGSIVVTISNAAITPDVVGIDSVCPNTTGLTYYIQDRAGAAHTWTISGGTITAGQGTNEITVDWDNTTGSGFVRVKEEINCGCAYTLITECGASGEPSFYWCPTDGDEIVYDQNRTLEGVLDVLTAACGDIESVSDFFEMNPPGDTPGYSAGINYVTGATNMVANLLVAQKSDIIDPGASNPSTRQMISFNDFMNMLREMFQVYWLIENGKLRLEHVSWFTRSANPNFDLTDAAKRKYIIGKNIYTYDKPKMPKYERYKWSEAIGTDFIGAEIRYESVCVNQDPKSNVLNHAPGNVTTDIGYIFGSPDEIEKTGFVFLANEVIGSVYTIASEAGKLSSLIRPNMHLSWANLHFNYHRHDRVLNSGYMNNQLTVFIDPKRTKKQEEISIPYCCDEELNPLIDLVTTDLGPGEIESMKFKIRSNTVLLTLLHDI